MRTIPTEEIKSPQLRRKKRIIKDFIAAPVKAPKKPVLFLYTINSKNRECEKY